MSKRQTIQCAMDINEGNKALLTGAPLRIQHEVVEGNMVLRPLACVSKDFLDDNVNFVRKIKSKNGLWIGDLPKDWKYLDEKLMTVAVKSNGEAIKDLSKGQQTFGIKLEAVKQNGLALRHLSMMHENMHRMGHSSIENTAIIIEAIKNNGDALAFAWNLFRRNIEYTKMAVLENGEAVRHFLGENCNCYFSLFDVAVSNNGQALKYAHRLQGNKGVVLKAVKDDGLALQYAHKHLRKDLQLIITAAKQNINALNYALASQEQISLIRAMLA